MFTDWCMVIHFLAGHGFLKLPASSLLLLTIIVGKSERFFPMMYISSSADKS